MSNSFRQELVPAEPFVGATFAVGILVLLASSLYSNLFLSAAALFALLFISTIAYFSSTRLDVAVRIVALLNVVFLMLYYPMFGFVLGHVESFDVGLLKIVVGIRPLLVFLGLCVIALFLAIRRHDVLWPTTLLFALSVSFFHSDSSFIARAAYFTNTLAPLFICLYVAGSKVDIKSNATNIYILFFSFALLIMLLYGALINNFFYDIFRPDLIYAIRARDLEPLAYGQIPGPWWSQIEGYSFIRFVGGFPDPIIAGYFFGVLVIIGISQRAYLSTLLAAFALFLTVSKGAWIFTVNVFIIILVLNHARRFLLVAVCGLLAVQLLIALSLDSSAYIHYKGLEGGLLSAMASPVTALIGFGMGSGGNLESIVSNDTFSREVWLSRGAESGVGTVVYQMGFLGLVLWVLLLWRLRTNMSRGPSDSSGNYALAMWLGLFVNAFLQENAINSSVLTIVLLGQFLIQRCSPSKQ